MLDSPRESLETSGAGASASASAKTPTSRKKRRSSSARRSISSANHSDEESYQGEERERDRDHDQDDGEESDPEDSETPWMCYMVLAETPPPPQAPTLLSSPLSASFLRGHTRARSRGTNVSPSTVVQPPTPTPTSTPGNSSFHPAAAAAPLTTTATVKYKVATLSPAPHHPKVVCQLKVPFPLPDVEVETGAVCRRVVMSDGSQCSTLSAVVQRGGGAAQPVPLTLTGEEIKDIVCSTAFWLVVREGVGAWARRKKNKSRYTLQWSSYKSHYLIFPAIPRESRLTRQLVPQLDVDLQDLGAKQENLVARAQKPPAEVMIPMAAMNQ
ncbi:hypothetical protein BU17DRAFT_72753 [Hysterangium stoloniferum]|nr:hypothetical protein BU17DRAFT_72753 [Hysterangium stoloniferum]